MKAFSYPSIPFTPAALRPFAPIASANEVPVTDFRLPLGP
jgi:hypothetical protein